MTKLIESYGYVAIKDYKKHQHYSHRNPPWIKLYNSLHDHYGFCRLRDQTKYHFVALLLLASRTDNKIPADPAWLANKISATSAVDLRALQEADLIEVIRDASNMLALDASTVLAPVEKSRVEKRREELSALTCAAVFWTEYPARNGAKRGKADCFAHWKRANLEEIGQEILTGLRAENKARADAERSNQFFAAPCDPIRWLKGRRWEDWKERRAPSRPFSGPEPNRLLSDLTDEEREAMRVKKA